MGHPPDSPSALAPAGTTAIPGLIPDLIAGTPWPRWALIAGALAAGVLIISCLLCAACCCCRRHRKKPRDKEAVGLGSARGITTTHLVQPDVDSLESSPGGAQQWGRLQLSLEYDFGSQEIRVGLRQAANLRPGGTVDPYARVSVSTQSGHRHETKVHRGTLCPVFDETCCFHIPQAELPGTTLQVQLFNFKRFSGHEPLGELRLPLGTVDLQHVLEHWYPLSPPAATEPEQVAELCFSLRYVPSSGRLTVVVLEARGLRPGLAEPYVKVQLMLNQRKWKKRKTATRKGTAAPYFNEAFTFLVPFSQVQATGKARHTVLRLLTRTTEASPARHQALNRAAQPWHPPPRLLGLGGSTRPGQAAGQAPSSGPQDGRVSSTPVPPYSDPAHLLPCPPHHTLRPRQTWP
ncbi:synaptotagmin-8 isoform X4 [Macaca nemestrina]|uniref:synaptotagmin-8 isoform X4 n=2 Tax=Macaca nemestrina TaxID=9545 RepID=UPI0039B92AFD